MKGFKWWVTVLMLVGLGGATSCAAVARPAADALIPVEEENQLGEELERELEDELPLHQDRQLTSYVSSLGEYIVDGIEEMPENLDLRFFVVDDPDMINAFAIPGGGVYIFTGLIGEMDNEAELAAVLSHEIAHVTRRHIAQRLVAAYGVELVSSLALGQEPGILRQLVTAVAQTGFMLRYSREHERDADAWGLRYLVDAGYDPGGLVSFFEQLEGQPTPPTFLSTHPPPAERIENIEAMIEQLEERPTRVETQRFQRMRDRI